MHALQGSHVQRLSPPASPKRGQKSFDVVPCLQRHGRADRRRASAEEKIAVRARERNGQVKVQAYRESGRLGRLKFRRPRPADFCHSDRNFSTCTSFLKTSSIEFPSNCTSSGARG